MIFYCALTIHDRILGEKIRSHYRLLEIFLVITIYLLLPSRGWVSPFRVVVAFFAFVLIGEISRKNINKVALLIGFFLAYIFWFIPALVSTGIIYFTGVSEEIFFAIIGVSLHALSYVLLWKFKFNNILTQLEDKAIRGLLFTAVALGWLIYTGSLVLTNITIDDPTANGIILGLLISLLVMFIATVSFLGIYFVKERKKKKEEQQQIKALRQEIRTLTSLNHKYRHIIPVLAISHQSILGEIEHIIGADTKTQLQRLSNHVKIVKELTSDIGEEFLDDEIKITVDELDIPENWFEVAALLEMLMNEGKKKGVKVLVYNHVSSWEILTVKRMDLSCLLGNIVDNAIKESQKRVDNEIKIVVITFKEVEGFFTLEVVDNAAEFPIHILQKLGEKGNSTNDTGDGYFEVFEVLARTKATLMINESQTPRIPLKKISVTFDGLNLALIESSYRKELLESHLNSSKIKPLDYENL